MNPHGNKALNIQLGRFKNTIIGTILHQDEYLRKAKGGDSFLVLLETNEVIIKSNNYPVLSSWSKVTLNLRGDHYEKDYNSFSHDFKDEDEAKKYHLLLREAIDKINAKHAPKTPTETLPTIEWM